MRPALVLALLLQLAAATPAHAADPGKEISHCPKGYQFEKGHGCMRPGCGALPPNCGNKETATCVDHKWQCGSTTCPALSCAAPPDGCWYGPPGIGNDGCKMGCGQLACDPDRKCEKATFPSCSSDRRVDCEDGKWVCQPKQCTGPQPKCKAPKKIACDDGVWRCEIVICPSILCPEPKAGCQYGPPYPEDANGCRVGCGEVVCKNCKGEPNCQYPQVGVCVNNQWQCQVPTCGNTPATCKAPRQGVCVDGGWQCLCPELLCPEPKDGCSYDYKMEDGCRVNCGTLVCPKGGVFQGSEAPKSLK